MDNQYPVIELRNGLIIRVDKTGGLELLRQTSRGKEICASAIIENDQFNELSLQFVVHGMSSITVQKNGIVQIHTRCDGTTEKSN